MRTSHRWRLVHNASAGTATIIRQFALADFGFLADVHLKDQDSRATIRLRGNDATQLEIALDAPLLGKHLHEGWNRIEVLLVGDHLWITVNNHTFSEPKTLKPGFRLGPLSIEGSGEVALASLFVRSVDGKR